MDLMILLGWVIGIGSIGWVLNDGETLKFFFNVRALVLVFGGTLGSTFITYPYFLLRRIPQALLVFVFPGRRPSAEWVMASIMNLATRARKSSMESVEVDLRATKDIFLANGLKMIADGLSPEIIRANLEKEIHFTQLRHAEISNLFRNMATYAPIFGLLGTLVGVVEVLMNLTDPKTMGAHMAVAMTATFYGIFGANFLFLPIAGKLQAYSEEEVFLKEVMIEGILSIYNKEAPAILSRRLQAYLNEHSHTIVAPVREKTAA